MPTTPGVNRVEPIYVEPIYVVAEAAGFA